MSKLIVGFWIGIVLTLAGLFGSMGFESYMKLQLAFGICAVFGLALVTICSVSILEIGTGRTPGPEQP